MDIGPGDRVQAIRDVDARSPDSFAKVGDVEPARIVAGRIYTVLEVRDRDHFNTGISIPACGLILVEPETHWTAWNGDLGGWLIEHFRKLPDISEWLETSTSYEEPRRVPAPREVGGV
ncbi:hypothetical protein [Phenylobacterium sp.]|uniref:hypothetical protein n=1 Tax=Phenylobacterium sp. TaxID=1871053 RepID=UPI0027322B05|nr:hypothetical protein [Phenylobacterium sp.]MDP1873677.1 hypothetical protein [Phenylobacterium sp.]